MTTTPGQPTTVASLAYDLGVPQDDIRVLVDQLVDIDGLDAVIEGEQAWTRSPMLSASAVATIRVQIAQSAPVERDEDEEPST